MTVIPNVTNIQNVDAIRTHGLEAAYQAADVLIKGLELGSSLTWADSIITKNDKFPGQRGQMAAARAALARQPGHNLPA